jgi:hypothetical protein
MILRELRGKPILLRDAAYMKPYGNVKELTPFA